MNFTPVFRQIIYWCFNTNIKSHPNSIHCSFGLVLISTEGTKLILWNWKNIYKFITVTFVLSVQHISLYLYFQTIPDPLRISSAIRLLRFWSRFLDDSMWNLFGMVWNSITVILAICMDGKTTNGLCIRSKTTQGFIYHNKIA